MAIVSTPGASNANAYGEVTVIDSYAVATAWAATWAALTPSSAKEALAIRAARALDQIAFAGWMTNDDQALQFPRGGISTPRGVMLDDETIPPAITRAWAHIAAWLSSFPATTDPFSVATNANIKREKTGPLETEYFAAPASDGSTFLSTVILPMLRPFGIVGAMGTVRLVR